MSESLGIIYYSACRIAPRFAEAVRAELLRTTEGRYPIVSVTHQPVDFGDVRIVVGDVPQGAWQVYQNALIGARAADTQWVACAEDDSLYRPCHFEFRPPDPDVFYYARNRWVLTRRLADDGHSRHAFFYFRERTQFAQLIARRSLLIEALEERFAKFPTYLPDTQLFPMGFGEPGRYEKNLGLPRRQRAYFQSDEPNITFNHEHSIRGRRKVNPDDVIQDDLEPWGEANALWRRIHG